VFDLDFSIYQNGKEIMLGANTAYNRDALKSAAGTWLNKYAMKFDFDSYEVGAKDLLQIGTSACNARPYI
jgi:hypothetical protein